VAGEVGFGTVAALLEVRIVIGGMPAIGRRRVVQVSGHRVARDVYFVAAQAFTDDRRDGGIPGGFRGRCLGVV
jgi:hypothetical protein